MGNEAGVFLQVFPLPFLHVGAAREIVEPLLEPTDQFQEHLVLGEIQKNPMEIQIQLVVTIPLAPVQGLDLGLVQLYQAEHVDCSELISDLLDCCCLERSNDLVGITDLGEDQLIHHHPPARQNGHETLAIQLDQSVAQRRTADPQLAADRVQIDRGSGGQAAHPQFFAQVGIELLAQRFLVDHASWPRRCAYLSKYRIGCLSASRRKGSAKTSSPPWIRALMTQGPPAATAARTTSPTSPGWEIW